MNQACAPLKKERPQRLRPWLPYSVKKSGAKRGVRSSLVSPQESGKTPAKVARIKRGRKRQGRAEYVAPRIPPAPHHDEHSDISPAVCIITGTPRWSGIRRPPPDPSFCTSLPETPLHPLPLPPRLPVFPPHPPSPLRLPLVSCSPGQ